MYSAISRISVMRGTRYICSIDGRQIRTACLGDQPRRFMSLLPNNKCINRTAGGIARMIDTT